MFRRNAVGPAMARDYLTRLREYRKVTPNQILQPVDESILAGRLKTAHHEPQEKVRGGAVSPQAMPDCLFLRQMPFLTVR